MYIYKGRQQQQQWAWTRGR